MFDTLTRLMAHRCENCPLCRRARERPDTLFGKVMHLHGKVCPFWRSWEKHHGAKAAPAGAPGESRTP
jgi:hypothetical protein